MSDRKYGHAEYLFIQCTVEYSVYSITCPRGVPQPLPPASHAPAGQAAGPGQGGCCPILAPAVCTVHTRVPAEELLSHTRTCSVLYTLGYLQGVLYTLDYLQGELYTLEYL